jgi:hypothetical protein
MIPPKLALLLELVWDSESDNKQGSGLADAGDSELGSCAFDCVKEQNTEYPDAKKTNTRANPEATTPNLFAVNLLVEMFAF